MENSLPKSAGGLKASQPAVRGSLKFIIGGALILAAVVYLIAASLMSPGGTQYFLTVDELNGRAAEMTGREVRISGVVLGDTIQYDPKTLDISFSVAHIPGDNQEIEKLGGLAAVLKEAAHNSSLQHLKVKYNGAKPDLLKDEAQAIMTGKLGADGVFQAEELLLKCPTKYEEAVPEQSTN
ncbi:MAG: cytochrome c maturation protein CcmE [Anaerolineaceae bacterium]|nr:cytochrome c maturation protein CcmE [Anaerolineaceae bacterium]